jgi:hypothetical protein
MTTMMIDDDDDDDDDDDENHDGVDGGDMITMKMIQGSEMGLNACC